MDDFLRSFLLVLCGIGAVILLVITYLWYFVFAKSLRAVLMAGLSILMNRDSKIDLDDDPQVVKRPKDVKNEMPAETKSMDFHTTIENQDDYVPQSRIIDGDVFGAQTAGSQSKLNELVSSSFEGGRFRRMKELISRPFLRARMTVQEEVSAENIRRGMDSSDTD